MIKLGALGDLILADGAMQDIRLHHPGAHITVLTRRAYASLLRRCPWVDAVIGDDNAPRWRLDRMLGLRRQLCEYQYVRVYDLQNSRRTRFYQRWLSEPANTWSTSVRDAGSVLTVPERHAMQLEAAGIEATHSARPSPKWIADDVAALLDHAGIVRPYVVLLPGSSARHTHKRWPHYAECSRLLQQNGVQVVTIPGVDEPELGQAHAGPHYAGVVLRPQGRVLDLHELAGVVLAAACVVGNDSGPTHLASCLGTRCVALIGARSPSLISTGIAQREGTMLVGDPVASITAAAVVTAVMEQLGNC